jgi:hypothetical protein
MTAKTEDLHAGNFLASEGPGLRARDPITVLSGQNLKAGAVLGKVTEAGATGAAVAGNTGNGTITVTGALQDATAKPGVYRAIVIEPGANLGTFEVEGPDGIMLGTGVVGTQKTFGGVQFTINDGATDFVSGDSFTITVAAGSGKYKEYNPANIDGSQTAVAVLFDAVDATSADKPGVGIVRSAEVTSSVLQWFAGASAGQKTTGLAQLALAGIIGR